MSEIYKVWTNDTTPPNDPIYNALIEHPILGPCKVSIHLTPVHYQYLNSLIVDTDINYEILSKDTPKDHHRAIDITLTYNTAHSKADQSLDLVIIAISDIWLNTVHNWIVDDYKSQYKISIKDLCGDYEYLKDLIIPYVLVTHNYRVFLHEWQKLLLANGTNTKNLPHGPPTSVYQIMMGILKDNYQKIANPS